MVNFCLYPHSYQPSGHINVSRAREFYLDYDLTDLVSNEINSGASAENGKAYQLNENEKNPFALNSDCDTP